MNDSRHRALLRLLPLATVILLLLARTGSAGTSKPGAVPRAKAHWAFQPVRESPIPAVKNRAWVKTPVDAFVLAALERKGLKPSPPADRRTLIRRVTFDLTGLPPTPAEVDAFLADTSANAWEKVVDRLLASPRYGERWARHWLDVARYADTKGYVFFEEGRFPWAYTYRDYVIRAFNDDLPYDRFILEQLAADKLPLGEDKRPLTAMGFLTLGSRFMNNQQDILDDRIDVTTRGLMGLTVSCARCHDHKFDPVPTKDYYSLYSVFANSSEPAVPPTFLPPPKTEKYATYEKELQAREKKLTDFVQQKHAEVVQGARTRAAEYMLAAHAVRDQPRMDDFMLLADGADLNPKMLLRWRSYLESTRRGRHAVFALWNALDALPEKEFAAKAPDIIKRELAAAGPPLNALVRKAFEGAPPATIKEAAERYAVVLNRVDKAWQEAVKARPSNQGPLRALPDLDEEQVRQVLYGPESPPMVTVGAYGDLALLPDRPSQAKLQELLKSLETWRAEGPEAPPRAMVLEDTTEPASQRIFLRGNPNTLGEAVPRRFLSVVSAVTRRPSKPFVEGSGRLELAKAIVDPANPLTGRVLVNRVWMHHFGQGLVHTPGDFGTRSEPPTHPELLDWLAANFAGVETGNAHAKTQRRKEGQGQLTTETQRHRAVYTSLTETRRKEGKDAKNVNSRTVGANKPPHHIPKSSETISAVYSPRPTATGSGPSTERQTPNADSANPKSKIQNLNSMRPWSIKSLHRIILLSNTYQQASDDRTDGRQVDPENLLLWKMNRSRLDFEALRDALISVSGKLDATVGGPAVNLFASPAPRRRTIYGLVDRLNLPGVLRTFDFPSPDATSPQRDSTTVPQQALFMMNHPFLTEIARDVMARDELRNEVDAGRRMSLLYRLFYSREPAPDEIRLGRLYLGADPKSVDWERYVQALLVANEFAFVD